MIYEPPKRAIALILSPATRAQLSFVEAFLGLTPQAYAFTCFAGS